MKKIISIISIVLTVALLTFVLCACVPSDVEKAEEKMEKAGYIVISYSDAEAEGLVGGISATKTGLTSGINTIVALCFDSSSSAKEYYDENVAEDSDIQKSGKWVFWGTEAAIEAFKG